MAEIIIPMKVEPPVQRELRKITDRVAKEIAESFTCRFGGALTKPKDPKTMTQFNYHYNKLVNDIMDNGVTETNARTNTEILMLKTPASFQVDVGDHLPVAGNRKYYPHIAAAEVAWQLMGTKDPTFILRWAPKLWSKFLNDEGLLETAYGYRWIEHFGRNQLALAVKELRENPTNRQLYISAWDPAVDGLGGPQPKNIPCPVGFSLTRVDDRLNLSVFIRSSDVYVGLPYDVMGYALMMDAISASLGIKNGSLHVTLAHPHIYEPHWEHVKQDVVAHGVEPTLPGWTLDMILEAPNEYVKTVRRLANRQVRPNWDPMPEVIE